MHLSYVVPVHNEEPILDRNVRKIAEHLANYSSGDIVLVENGSNDRSWEICDALASSDLGVELRAFREPARGLGHAYDRALRELQPRGPDHWIVLGAADLPFEMTDLVAATPHFEGPCDLILGSKGHPDSHLVVSAKRRLASIAYRGLRRGLLGMRARDCQGSIIIRAPLAAQLRELVRSRNYFYTTEFVFLAEKSGKPWIEVPVALAPDERKSTVSLLGDGARMGLQLLRLGLREGRVPRR